MVGVLSGEEAAGGGLDFVDPLVRQRVAADEHRRVDGQIGDATALDRRRGFRSFSAYSIKPPATFSRKIFPVLPLFRP